MTWLSIALTASLAIWIALAVHVFSRIKELYGKGDPYTDQLLATWFLMWAFHHLPLVLASLYGVWPLPLGRTLAFTSGALVTIAGVVILAVGMTTFGSYDRSAGKDTSRLITSGIYRWSRNPQFIGWVSILLGISLAGRSGFALALAFLLLVILHWYTVRLEEPYLERIFGDEYRLFASKTARWVGKPK